MAEPVRAESNEGSRTFSLIIKIWIEETAEEAGRTIWRGHISHVPSGEQHYVKDLSDITGFIVPYLLALGVHRSWRWRLWQWFNRLI